MNEKILKAKPGIPMLILFIALYLVAVGLIILGAILLDSSSDWGAIPFVVGLLWSILGIIPFCGLKLIQPQEALVLTLFGKYIGTLKEAGFFYVNPFSSAINPAYKTQLGQSSDVSGSGNAQAQAASKKISLKVMTLNNYKQKVNDVLEIG